MKRRQSLKLMAAGAVSVPAILSGCKEPEKNPETKATGNPYGIDRFPEELNHEKELLQKENFFTPDELALIRILCDIIIPADEVSGSATQAGVPDFIEFIVKDKPELQTPVRGGLRWLNALSIKRFGASFKDCNPAQQTEIIDLIAYPERVKNNKELSAGAAFFSLMRNLTASGFYTSEIGLRDLGYMGNKPNQWNGVPDEVLKEYQMTYSEKELRDCLSFSNTAEPG
ncbi:MAG: gluconate 2-dehydrogenase subunit 3 family protein [Chitinophagaceae bacterium]|nr:gluconate 2-dehydrogenase subunit 3 family protein [Chitinophagaceae bacterium]